MISPRRFLSRDSKTYRLVGSIDFDKDLALAGYRNLRWQI
jgi:hypothetical protein